MEGMLMTEQVIVIDDKKLDRIFAEVDELKLSKWEFDFVKSTKVWWTQRRKLSDKQKNRLAEIWRKQHVAKA
jgi:hypothetical protein